MAKRQKRQHGEGSFYRRPDGRFEGKVHVGYVNGKPKYRYVSRSTKREALAAWEALKREHAAGATLHSERQTLGQFLDQWLSDVVAQRCRPTTSKMYRESVRRIQKHIAHVQLSKLTPHHVQGMLRALAGEGYAPATVDRARDVLINALGQAEQWQRIPRNVAKLTPKPKVESYEPRVLTPQEAHQLLAAAIGDRLEVLWRVALGLGLRRGEILGLRWNDIDLDGGTLRITVNLQLLGGKLVLVRPKTKESQRTIPIPLSLITVLRQHRARQLQERLQMGNRWSDHGLVFCTGVGTPIAPRNLTRSLKTLLKRAGLPDMRLHDLRHSCASLLAAQGVAPKVAQEILGHSDIRTTLHIYTHVTDAQKQAATAMLDAMLDGSQEAAG